MRTKGIIIIVAALALISGVVFGQQKAQYTQYMNNNYILNPAAGGTEDYIDIKACFRKQWVNMQGGPTSYYLTAHSPLGKYHGKPHIKNSYNGYHSIGGSLSRDVTTPITRTAAYLSYGYNIPLVKSLRLSLAAAVGMQQYALDGSNLSTKDPDPVLVTRVSSVPDATLGAWLYSDKFYVGIADAQILQSKLAFNVNSGATVGSKLNSHYFVTAGVRLPINHDFILIPSSLLKYVAGAPVSIDLNVKCKFQDFAWIGLSYRRLDSFAGMAGVTIRKWIDIGYSYDASISELIPYNHGSHEILVGIRLKSRKDIICPANFW